MLGDRIKSLRISHGMTQEELGKLIGVGKSTINKYELDKIAIPSAKVEALARVLGVSPGGLMGWELPDSYPVGKLSAISVIGSVRAGIGGIAQEEHLGTEFADADPEEHRFFMVKGDSMSPQICEGDLALVHKQDDVESGELAVVIVNGEEGLIKKVLKHEGAITLVSFNQAYPPRVFVGKEMNEVKIWGKVKQTMHRW